MKLRLLWTSLFVGGGLVWSAAAQQNPEAFIFDRCPRVADVLSSPAGLNALVDPVFTSRAAVGNAVEEWRQMLGCLDSVRFQTVLPDWFGTARQGLELFLAFAPAPSGPDRSSLELIDLARVNDPALRQLRDDVGLRVPEGLVFVRYFPSRDALPEVVRPAFGSLETRAVTIGSRYVAVLTQTGLTGAGARTALESTFSHEMVHAFLNAGLDWSSDAGGFPSWFHEGMAIHFSRSGRVHVGWQPGGGIVRVSPTREYEAYERVFRYMEDTLGKPAFYRLLRQVVGEVDVGPLFDALGVEDYAGLERDAGLWSRWWPVPPRMVRGGTLWVFAAGLVVLFAVGVGVWRRWQPAVPGSALEVSLNRNLVGAVREGDGEELGYLLRSGADPNARDEAGWPALQWAVWTGRADIVEQLLNHGARVTAGVRELAEWSEVPDIERLVADASVRQQGAG